MGKNLSKEMKVTKIIFIINNCLFYLTPKHFSISFLGKLVENKKNTYLKKKIVRSVVGPNCKGKSAGRVVDGGSFSVGQNGVCSEEMTSRSRQKSGRVF